MFRALAGLVARYPRWVLGAWFVVSAVSLPFASRVGDVLNAQPEAPRDGTAAAVQTLLATAFQGGEEVTLVAVAHGVSVRAGSPEYAEALDDVKTRLLRIPGTTSVRDYRTASGLDLLDEANDLSVLLVGLDASGLTEGKRVTEAVRAALDSVGALRFDLSGGPATVVELEQVSERDARRAEVFGLPISLLILVVAFGAVVASVLPLLSAVTTIVTSLGLLYFVGQQIEFAVFTETIVTMLGLATGIDYALLIVNRFREELRSTFDARKAAARTAETAGKAVAFSGLTVIVGLMALLVPPVAFIRSIGVGAMVVLFVSVLVAITAVPATLALLGHRVNWLRVTKREPGLRSRAFWRGQATRIMRRPRFWFVTGVLVLVGLSLPGLRMQVADPGARGLTSSTDARRTLNALEGLGLEGLLNPFDVVVDFGPEGFYRPENVRKVSLLTQRLRELEHVAGVSSPMALESIPKLFLYQYYATAELALASEIAPLARATVSGDGRYALAKLVPVGALTPAQGAQVYEGIEAALSELGLRGAIGGVYVQGTEWTHALYAYFPLALALVALTTAFLLGMAFKSLLIPIKAVLLNALTVCAAFGVMTLVHQDGILYRLFGLGEVLGYVDTSAPLFIFAIVFGLSMDYEVFMVARIHEAHERGMSDHDAVATAISTTGGVITSAAAVMVTVFALLIFSHVELIRTLGLGLSVAVILDATLVRLALVQTLMTLAGK
ncbi:MAG: MMPL family transporter, partial [Trueperaceae bacterium]|nr:MMPL family transporter [Trueperaceae bacterium]